MKKIVVTYETQGEAQRAATWDGPDQAPRVSLSIRATVCNMGGRGGGGREGGREQPLGMDQIRHLG